MLGVFFFQLDSEGWDVTGKFWQDLESALRTAPSDVMVSEVYEFVRDVFRDMRAPNICKSCGSEFYGARNWAYCKPCREKRRYRNDYRVNPNFIAYQDEADAKWESNSDGPTCESCTGHHIWEFCSPDGEIAARSCLACGADQVFMSHDWRDVLGDGDYRELSSALSAELGPYWIKR